MKILITSAWNGFKKHKDELIQSGHDVIFVDDKASIDENIARDIEYTICNSLFLNNELSKFSKLKTIQVTSAGLDRLPMKDIKERHINVFNAGGVYSIPISEFVICSILDLYKDKFNFYEKQKNKQWEKNRNLDELFAKKVLILGCGGIGLEIGKRLNSFGCQIDGVDKKGLDLENFNNVFETENIPDIIGRYDIVISCLPLTENTFHIFDEKLFSLMNDKTIFVNMSRGQIVDENALIKRLQNGLRAGILDVFEEEPLSKNSPLWNMDNVLIYPHNSFASISNEERLSNLILKNLQENK